ncbi:MAG: ABC transporter ATP-binding protein [Planctomycetota bacterium]|jgi:ABC-type multidrug transport system fused ATPase/permease subunit
MKNRLSSSRKQFKEFISEKGFFGNKKTENDHSDQKTPKKDRLSQKSQDKDKKEPSNRDHKKYFWRYMSSFADQKSRIVLIIFMMIIAVCLETTMPWAPKYMLDYVMPTKSSSLLIASCFMLAVIGLSAVAINLLRDLLVRSLLGNFVTSTKRKLMKHLQHLPLERLHELKVGGVVTRLQSDTEAMASLFQQGILTPITSIFMFAVALTSLIILNLSVTLICLIFSIFVLGISYVIFNIMRPFQKSLRQELSVIGGHISETFSGIEVVRSFSQEKHETKNFGFEVNTLFRKNLHAQFVSMLVHRTVRLLFWGLTVSIWMYGGYKTFQGHMTVGDLMAFIAFTGWLFQPIFMIMSSMANMQVSLACTERVFDLFDEPIAMPDKEDAIETVNFEEELKINNVSFRYPDGAHALSDSTITFPKGKVTAIVGSSGAGKSTITNLIMRFYEPTCGRLELDGHDIRNFKLSSYRKILSMVLQETFLFDGSVKENIAYGNPDATDKDVETAAQIAHCHDFILDLEEGYETVIGERGVKLSGGQKQRLALARAISTDPQILILDEATSSLDSESEELIQVALKDIFKDRTTVVIAHRLSTIMDADNIIVMSDGKVVEEGRHEELLKNKGRYFELYTTQIKKDKNAGLLEILNNNR